MYEQICWLSAANFAGWPRELCGYLASGLVLLTFSMQSMRKLRVIAVASNVAFIAYSVLAGLHPVFALHCVLLPLNVYRLMQSALETPAAAVWVQKFLNPGLKKSSN